MNKQAELIWRRQRAWHRHVNATWAEWQSAAYPASEAEQVMTHINAMSAGSHWLESRFDIRPDPRQFYRPTVTVDGITFEWTAAQPPTPIISDDMWAEMDDGLVQSLLDPVSKMGRMTFQELCHEMTRIEISRTRAALLNGTATIEPAPAHPTCRECGCTETRACVDDRGPCWWAEADLCSHCAAPHPNPCPPGCLKPDGYQVNEAD